MYAQAHKPVRKQRTAEGHAVRANYMYSAMADLAYEYQDKELQQACRNLWDNMVHKRMYITGSVGSSGFLERFTTDYDLPNDSNYSETCATIALAMFGKRMADMEKDASYMDVVERALYNTLLSGIAMDGKAFLCKSSGSMAGKLYAENFTRTCETCQAEMVWCCMLPAKHYQNIGISWTIHLFPRRK